MARPLCVEYPGAFYHVINSGNADEYLKPLSRYIHLNPVRVNLLTLAGGT